jgi:hypothetical protein
MAAADSLSAGLSARDESYIAFFNSVVAGNAEAALSALHVHLIPRYCAANRCEPAKNAGHQATSRIPLPRRQRVHIAVMPSAAPHRLARRLDLARRALEVAGEDPAILANAALALAYFGEDIGAMMALVDRAVTLNPSFARGWYISGAIRVFADCWYHYEFYYYGTSPDDPDKELITTIGVKGQHPFVADADAPPGSAPPAAVGPPRPALSPALPAFNRANLRSSARAASSIDR